MPNFSCEFTEAPTPLDHFWEHTLGSGHAPLALRADWQQQILKCHREIGVKHVRFHAILSDEMETLICQNNEFLYSFFNTDQIWDYLLSIGVCPFVELSFMPEALASGDKHAFRYYANVTPPANYHQWAMLINRLVGHWIERYGHSEVCKWFFEVWNEPNLEAFWTGKLEDYFKLYRSTVEAIKRLDQGFKVGGPATAMNAWIPEFLEICETHHVPVDFITTHYYPTDPLGTIYQNTVEQLAQSPRDIMRQKAEETYRNAQGKPVYYTEWSSSSNPRDPLHDEPYAAAFVTRTIMGVNGLVDGYSYWTFSDIFDENYFPSIPFQGGFGLLNIYGIPKPTYRAYEILHHLGTHLLPVQGEHETVEAWVIRNGGHATVLLTNHVLPTHPVKTETVHLSISGLPQPLSAYLERIDDEHANPKRLWCEMGEPKYLSRNQVEQLMLASQLVKEPVSFRYQEKKCDFELTIPPHGVAAITLELAHEENNGGSAA